MKRFTPSDKSRVRRLPDRARYDVETVYSILDAGFVCHVGYVIDGAPYVTPTAYWREGDHLYWHGSHASRMLDVAAGQNVCVSVTHVDGLVVARSAFHHSVNYRSAMLFGTARLVDDMEHKERALERFVERIYPGRWSGLRPVTRNELKATKVLHMKIDEASAKIRSGPPNDDAEDYSLPIWAGVVPLSIVHGEIVPDERLARDIAAPENMQDFSRIGVR
jgi:nitroimidazol reductase NimA-like FMN-containing flavoprotein (pyridoxamine 5'-phosphate oxidase superfamily)